jgi:TolA-binding protein
MRAWAAAGALALTLGGCGAGADELLDTAALEEQQSNPSHARELYRQVVERFPGTPQAARAEERLRQLGSHVP